MVEKYNKNSNGTIKKTKYKMHVCFGVLYIIIKRRIKAVTCGFGTRF